MPASNMAGPLVVPANPSAGKAVIMSPFSGPDGSPLDNDNAGNNTTGAMSTGIGYGLNAGPVINVSTGTSPATAAQAIKNAGFDDDMTPGHRMPNGTAAPDARLLAIGGGRNSATADGQGVNNPYAVQPILAFGAGTQRDAGAGPAFTGRSMAMVTAAGTVADGAAIETTYINRTGVTMVATESAFGSNTAASAAVT